MALGLVGRRGRDYFARRGFEVRYEQVNLFAALQFDDAQAIAGAAIEAFSTGEVDSVYLVYNEFKSVMSQRVVVERLLPIPRLDDRAPAPARRRTAESRTTSTSRRRTSCSRTLIPRHVEVQVFRALLESNAAFYAAQMTAMDAATRNSARHDRAADAVHEQGAPGGDHARDHRSRVGRAGAVERSRVSFNAGSSCERGSKQGCD